MLTCRVNHWPQQEVSEITQVQCCNNQNVFVFFVCVIHSQDLQRDIEKHSTGVASVLNLCEVLLHDCDACSTETECDSIQQATRGLDRRWRNICAMSMERRLKSVTRSDLHQPGPHSVLPGTANGVKIVMQLIAYLVLKD